MLALTSYGQNWTSIADMPGGRHHPVTFGLNGFGYAVTGSDENSNPSNTMYKYDPGTDTWSSLSGYSGPARSFGIGDVDNGIAYMGFGLDGNFSYLNDIWEFDASTETWSMLTTCPCSGRRHPAFIVDDGKIFVGLGDDQSQNLKDWYTYDIGTDTWSGQDDLPGAGRHHPFQFVIDGLVYTGMGHGGPIVYDDWYRYDPATNGWNIRADFPGQSRVAGTQFSHGPYGYVLSGDGSDHGFMAEGEFWQYSPGSDSWAQMTSHPGNSLWAPGSFVIDDMVYLVGGQDRAANDVILRDAMSFPLPLGPPAAIDEAPVAEAMQLYPSPATSQLSIQSPFDIKEIQVLSVAGKVALTAGANTRTIDVENLPAGIYVLQVLDQDGNRHTQRWVKG